MKLKMIKSRIYYYIRMQLLSPISIGNGDDILTDHDCLKNSKGYPFIPGTSLAGVFSHYLNDEQKQIFTPRLKDDKVDLSTKLISEYKEEEIFASKSNADYKQSPFFISDANIFLESPQDKVVTSIRDGIKLDEYKITVDGAKFDFEIVETGTKFDFRIEVIARENDDISKMKDVINTILNGFNKGEILLGFKSKRGYGKVKLLNTKIREFEKSQIDELIDFNKYDINEYKEYEISNSDKENRYDYIKVNLKQLGGISIRRYSAKAGNVDFEHVTSNGKPVIPGTSWNGLIRRQITEYLKSNLLSESGVVLTDWFGKEKNGMQEASASNIIIEESVIDNYKKISLMRNKIDRFSGGSANRALFSEISYFNGITTLGIKIKKHIKQEKDNLKIIGLIALVIKDIDNGLIALGGQTSIGRGLFKVEDVTLNGQKMDLDEAIGGIFNE